MSEIIDQFYTPLLIGHGFIRDPDNQQYWALGDCWKLSPEVGEGTYWTYGQKDLYDIKIHNFSFHEDFMLECSLPECLSITRYDSISGEELSPYRRLSAGCIKTFIGGYAPYKALIQSSRRKFLLMRNFRPLTPPCVPFGTRRFNQLNM